MQIVQTYSDMIITKLYHYYKENQNRKIYWLFGKSILT